METMETKFFWKNNISKKIAVLKLIYPLTVGLLHNLDQNCINKIKKLIFNFCGIISRTKFL